MVATAIIVFREVLEATLIVTIVLAAAKHLVRRFSMVSLGILTGIAVATGVAIFASQISSAAGGIGQELFNALVLLAAVAMIGWHVIWMAQHGQALTARIQQVSTAVRTGERPLAALFLLVAFAVLREGSEIVLFLYGMVAGGVGKVALIVGSVAGLAAAVLVGIVLYFSLLRIPVRQLFRVTNGLLVLLAAGLASQASLFLIQADLLPSLGTGIWDTSRVLSEQSVIGQILHVLIGYSARPAGMQLLFYGVTVITFLVGARRCNTTTTDHAPSAA